MTQQTTPVVGPAVYPLARPGTDPRFTAGLLIDVAQVLAEAGYPPIVAGGDLVRLQQALFGFLYARRVQP